MKSHPLFPNYFKKVGILLIIIPVVITIILSIIHGLPLPHNQLIKRIIKLLSFTGFAFIIFSKEKVEDEFIATGRLRAGAVSFFCVIIIVIIRLFVSLFTDEFIQSTEAMLLQQCIFYLISFQMYKAGMLTFKNK